MRYDRVHIESLAHETPPIRLTSEELEERLAPCYAHYCLQPGFLFEHSGVKARHLLGPGQTLSGAAVLTHESVSRTSHRLVGGHQMTFPKHNQLCRSSSL